MAITVNSVTVNIIKSGVEKIAEATAVVALDATHTRTFTVRVNAARPGIKTEIYKHIKDRVMEEQAIIAAETAANGKISAAELETYLNA